MNWTDLVQRVLFTREDGTKVEAEMMFLALDKPKDVKKLRGLQLTGGWPNEIKELPWEAISMLFGRCGRYPRRGEVDPYWYGLVGDTNAPDEDHWYYKLAEEEKPEGWCFVRQPPAVIKRGDKWEVNPGADNLHNLPEGYYENQIAGHDDDWISVNLGNNYGFVKDGKPVHPWYNDQVHCSPELLEPDRKQEVVLGLDFGRTPACAFAQKDAMGRWRFVDEFTSNNMSAETFAPELKRYIDQNYSGFTFKMGWGDPSGGAGNQSTDRTPFDILRSNGIVASPTSSNDPLMRRASLSSPGMRNCMDGRPALLISPKCKMLRKGLAGGFCYKRVQVSGEKYADKPDKSEYSHIVEAAEYALQGEGEGSAAVHGKPAFRAPVKINQYNPMRR
ncbi:hypothetical protein [uncultured Paraglaciecola sp.]|uniref:hypothetical protein n=1 Tax=uncultured Paraglaciecola sp. TaxID=1765024 RepID=UPI002634C612|nr:hypothetical protein [uncultured Paraglaciecola sp.]